MDLVEEDILMHYGVKRRSGRYPWGSGDNPYQHGGDFLGHDVVGFLVVPRRPRVEELVGKRNHHPNSVHLAR